MRWFWIDRFTEFVAGSHATAIKNVTLSEPHVIDYEPALGQLAQSLTVEGVAQTGGLLVSQASDFRERVVLAKIAKAVFHRVPRPGQCLTYRAELQSLQPDGAIVSATSHVDGELHAEMDVMFAYLDDRFAGVTLFEPAAFLRLLRFLRMFEVGRTADGQPLPLPMHLVEAERRLLAEAT